MTMARAVQQYEAQPSGVRLKSTPMSSLTSAPSRRPGNISIAETISSIQETLKSYSEEIKKSEDLEEPLQDEEKVAATVHALVSLQSHLVSYSDHGERRSDVGLPYLKTIQSQVTAEQYEHAWDTVTRDPAIMQWKETFGRYRSQTGEGQ